MASGRTLAVRRGRVRSQLQGVASTRRMLRRIGPEAKNGIVAILEAAEPGLLAAVKADAPVRTGALKEALSGKVLKSSMRLRVGLTSAAANRKYFYARILEFGRKANTASRGGAIAARPFVFKKRPALREALNRRLNKFWDDTLIAASAGVGDD